MDFAAKSFGYKKPAPRYLILRCFFLALFSGEGGEAEGGGEKKEEGRGGGDLKLEIGRYDCGFRG
jgi:hypothetical protein